MSEMEALGGILARLTRAEQDIEQNSRYRHEMRSEISKASQERAVLRAAVTEIKEDVGEVKDSMKWVLRGLVGATITFSGLIVTIIVAVFGH